MSDMDINEAFRRLARGERFAPADQPPEVEELPQAHGSVDGGSGAERPAPNTVTDINQLFRALARDAR
jgi:hypothetical protein